MSLGERLKEARLKAGLTQKTASEILHIHRTVIGKYENNYCSPTTDHLTSLIDIYRADANYILFGSTDNEFVSLRGLPNNIKQKIYFLINSVEQ